jgi:hypothetical protein
VGRTKYAGESLLKLVNSFDEEVYISGPITEWISGEFTFTCLLSCLQAFPSAFTHRCLSVPESDSGVASKAARHDDALMLHLNPLTLTTLEGVGKATLARRSWKDALVAAASVSIFFCSGTYFVGLTLLVWNSWFRDLRSTRFYVNVSKQSTT